MGDFSGVRRARGFFRDEWLPDQRQLGARSVGLQVCRKTITAVVTTVIRGSRCDGVRDRPAVHYLGAGTILGEFADEAAPGGYVPDPTIAPQGSRGGWGHSVHSAVGADAVDDTSET